MKKYIFLIILYFFNTNSFSSSSHDGMQLLKKYNFNDGTYTVVGIISQNKNHEIQKILGNFYISDINDLNNIKNKWITNAPSPFYACGYHYNINVLKNGIRQETFLINLDDKCNTVVTNNGYYHFNMIHIKELIGVAKSAKKENKVFLSLEQARCFYQLLLRNKKLLFVHKPVWEKFDGSFQIFINLDEEYQPGQSVKKYLDRAVLEIENLFPNEVFSVKQSGMSIGPEGKTIIVKIQGSKRLFDKFKIYKKDGNWHEFQPVLTIYWK